MGEDLLQTDRLRAGKGDPFAAAIRATRMPIIITDPKLDDNPIVYANGAFARLTGYGQDEILGQNCRFLQGPATDRESIAELREAIADNRDLRIDLLNYRRDGTSFWNALYLSPVVDESGTLQFFFASLLDVSDKKEAERQLAATRAYSDRMHAEKERAYHELQELNAKLELAVETKTALLHEVDHRVKNNLQMISSLVLLQSRTIEDPATRRSLRDMLTRIEALGTVHRRLYQSDDVTRFDIGEFVRDLVTELCNVAARDRVVARFDLASVTVPAELASSLALIVNEIATNALKHAFPDGRTGVISASVAVVDNRLRIAVADDGIGRPTDVPEGRSFGTSLIRTLSRQLKAGVDWAPAHPGTRVTIDLPMDVSHG